MSDVYVPGLRSRFDSEKTIQDLMRLERVPKDRAEENVSRLEAQKSYWQDVGRRMTSLRESARSLYSFQNPFSDRLARSSDESALTATAMRETNEQIRNFTIKQIAQADRFLSEPLENSFRVESGNYSFTVGKDEISFDFRGGTLKEFVDILNRRGRDKIQASLIAVKPGTNSLLIESKVTGAENRMSFSGAAEALGLKTGMVELANDSRQRIEGDYQINAGENSSIRAPQGINAAANLVLRYDTTTTVRPTEPWTIPRPPPGPSIPTIGSISYGGIVIQSEASTVSLPPWEPPPPPRRVDDMDMVSLSLSNGNVVLLPPVTDSTSWKTNEYALGGLPAGVKIVSIDVMNYNTHRDVSLRNIQVLDPNAIGGIKPLNPVSTAQDAIITMEGIEIQRPGNAINDLLPGITLTLKNPTEKPVNLTIEPDREGVKNAIVSLIVNYNLLMAEINILTRTDTRVLDELTYLSKEEKDNYQKRLGAFQADSTLNQFRNVLQRTVTSPYPTSLDRELSLLSQIGIGSDIGRGGASTGYDATRLRGYLEFDEKTLDAAIATKLVAIKELFGSDTSGDLLVDTGIAYNLETLARPYVETGGIISLKTGTADSRIGSEQRRIDTFDRQLAAKEAELKSQYAQMESAYSRMERMAQSLDRFSQQNSNNNNR